MRHLSVFYCEDIKAETKFGTVEICEMPKEPNRYAYYFRSIAGEYTELKALESMSVQECRTFEETQLRELVKKHVASLDVDTWNIYRTRPMIWDDISKLTPEITNRLFIESKNFPFEEDEIQD